MKFQIFHVNIILVSMTCVDIQLFSFNCVTSSTTHRIEMSLGYEHSHVLYKGGAVLVSSWKVLFCFSTVVEWTCVDVLFKVDDVSKNIGVLYMLGMLYTSDSDMFWVCLQFKMFVPGGVEVFLLHVDVWRFWNTFCSLVFHGCLNLTFCKYVDVYKTSFENKTSQCQYALYFNRGKVYSPVSKQRRNTFPHTLCLFTRQKISLRFSLMHDVLLVTWKCLTDNSGSHLKWRDLVGWIIASLLQIFNCKILHCLKLHVNQFIHK